MTASFQAGCTVIGEPIVTFNSLLQPDSACSADSWILHEGALLTVIQKGLTVGKDSAGHAMPL